MTKLCWLHTLLLFCSQCLVFLLDCVLFGGFCFFLPQKKAIRKLKAVTRTFLYAVSRANMTQIPVAISEVIKKSSRLESMKGFALLKKTLKDMKTLEKRTSVL